jgi:hypothetical protein
LQGLRTTKADEEDLGLPFAQMAEYRQAERVWETSLARFSNLAEDLVAWSYSRNWCTEQELKMVS